MEENLTKQNIFIKGMTCASCEKIIRKQAFSIEGVKEIRVDYSSGYGYVEFDSSKTDIDSILYKIEEKGYEGFLSDDTSSESEEKKSKIDKWLSYGTLILGILVVGYFLLQFTDKIQLPQISPTMSYGLLFLVGLLTGFHCVAMCGGFVVSYTAKNAQEGKPSHKSHIAYGSGKLISYTVIGAAFGLIGAIITFTPFMRGIAGIISGLFLLIFGLNMLNIFPFLRKVRITTPNFINKFLGKQEKNSNPFMIGLFNGLMIACGPLQAIYIMAAGTGSVVEGAKLLFIFGLGTLPVMLGFGYITSFISSKMANKILKFSGIVVIILGIIMINRGLAVTGTGYDANSLFSNSLLSSSNDADTDTSNVVTNNGYQEIKMDVLSSGWSPNKFVLKKGVPVKWIINGKELNGCNSAIQVPKLGLSFKIKPGLQTIEFTPNEEGTVPFSCWMGMIQGQFIVKSDIDLSNKDAVQKELDSVQAPKSSGSCSMGSGGGGCGCGG
ncbi:MAG: sulfite exporter TauE/SafE family protein [archaeon]